MYHDHINRENRSEIVSFKGYAPSKVALREIRSERSRLPNSSVNVHMSLSCLLEAMHTQCIGISNDFTHVLPVSKKVANTSMKVRLDIVR